MRRAVAILITVGCLQSAVAAEIYCNAQGRDCSDRPSATRSFVRSSSVGASAAIDAGTAGGTSADPAAADPVQQQRERNATLAKAQQQLTKDLNDKRSEQCKAAQNYYKGAVGATFMYRTDKDGKRVDLSAKELSEARLNAKLNMDRSCAPSGG